VDDGRRPQRGREDDDRTATPDGRPRDRSAFQDAIQHRFISEVERLSGRRVTMFVSNSHVGHDLEVELFVLAP
jgi:hypothetical protein